MTPPGLGIPCFSHPWSCSPSPSPTSCRTPRTRGQRTALHRDREGFGSPAVGARGEGSTPWCRVLSPGPTAGGSKSRVLRQWGVASGAEAVGCCVGCWGSGVLRQIVKHGIRKGEAVDSRSANPAWPRQDQPGTLVRRSPSHHAASYRPPPGQRCAPYEWADRRAGPTVMDHRCGRTGDAPPQARRGITHETERAGAQCSEDPTCVAGAALGSASWSPWWWAAASSAGVTGATESLKKN